jgi:glycerol uptake facilitator-like aquaporin
MTAVGRRLLAEYIGTGLLVAVVVGSGIAATRLTHDGALQLLVNSVVTAFGLAVLILVFIPAGGAHFNPVVTAADWILGRHTPAPPRPGRGCRRHGLPGRRGHRRGCAG